MRKAKSFERLILLSQPITEPGTAPAADPCKLSCRCPVEIASPWEFRRPLPDRVSYISPASQSILAIYGIPNHGLTPGESSNSFARPGRMVAAVSWSYAQSATQIRRHNQHMPTRAVESRGRLRCQRLCLQANFFGHTPRSTCSWSLFGYKSSHLPTSEKRRCDLPYFSIVC